MNKFDFYSEESELAIVRTLILEPQLIGGVLCDLSDDDFVNEHYRKFIAVIFKMFRAGLPVGLPEVCLETGESQKITDSWINADYTSSLHLPAFIQKVKKLSALRKLKQCAESSNDPNEIILATKEVESRLETRKIKSFSETIASYEKHVLDKKNRLREGRGIGLTTGFKLFDKEICLEPTHLVCLAARSSIGKSALALNLAVNAAMYEQNVLYFSVEMREESLVDRICALLTGVSIGKFKHVNADASYPLAKLDFVQLEKHLKIQYLPSCTSEDVCTLTRKESFDRKIDLVVVDYLQYLGDPMPKGGTNNDRIGGITKKFKGLAGELGCCVLMLSQVNRKTSGMPELENLRDSGNIEQDSDLVLMLDREDRQSCIADLAVKKAREGEAERAIQLKFNPMTTKFNE